MHSEEFRRAIEQIKQRAPIEEVVRERVPALKKSGASWKACCPFHDEKTPSFTVDPRRGTWHCFGACSTGGDQIRFLERLDNLSFMEALEILAARTGIDLPRRRGFEKPEKDVDEPLYQALLFAQRFYVRQLASPEGRAASEYVLGRGLTRETIEVFGLGFAPANGQALQQAARESGITFDALEAAGLARQGDSGRPYDFFRGRLVIPIRDVQARVIGFGARRLGDGDESGPKYINTAETRLFHKGRQVYAIDRAQPVVRRTGHIVLMEGYTDVMAAHQVGLAQCVAVLGTATTEDHASLIRKSGARRVTLLFDGDEAGRKAAWKALAGLLQLDVTLDVVSLTGGQDPCDVLVREGAAPLLAQFDLSRGWFDFVCDGLAALSGIELSRAVDSVLELVVKVPRPVQRESLVQELSRKIGISVEALREQWRATHRPRDRGTVDAPRKTSVAAPSYREPRLAQAYEGLLGALLLDASLVPLARAERAGCVDPDLAAIFDAVLELYADENAVIDEGSVLALLVDHPARERVVPIAETARSAESARALLDGQLRYLAQYARARERAPLENELCANEHAAAHAADETDVEAWKRLYEERRRELSTP